MPKINPVDVKVQMLRKGIKPYMLQAKFGVGAAAVSMALSGERKELLGKINQYVQKCKPAKAA